MPRITQKGQVTIPKKIRDRLGIKPNDIGEFTIKEGSVVFTVKSGSLLDAHKKASGKSDDVHKIRKLMKSKHSKEILKEME